MKVTAVQIKECKKKHGEVFKISVPLDDSTKPKMAVGYFKKPDADTLSIVSTFAANDPIKTLTGIFDKCWLGGDEKMQKQDELKLSAAKDVNELFKLRPAKVAKL